MMLNRPMKANAVLRKTDATPTLPASNVIAPTRLVGAAAVARSGTWIAAALLCCVLLACGGAEPGALIADGQRALSAADWDQALADFERAAQKLEPSDPLYVAAKLGCLEARAVAEPDRTLDEFLVLAQQHEGLVRDAPRLFRAKHVARRR
jgi:hypothetical protein